MDIVEFTKDLAQEWSGCLGCTRFGTLLIKDRAALDLFKVEEGSECCSYLFIEDYKIIGGFDSFMRGAQERKEKAYCDHVFNILVLSQSDHGRQDHSEIENRPEEESRWAKYIAPKIKCLGCGYDFNDCLVLPAIFDVHKWNVLPEYNVSSNNFDGIRIEITLRKYL